MTEQTPTPTPKDVAPTDPPPTPSLKDLPLDEQVEKWKGFSRQNERDMRAQRERADAAERELAELRQSQLSDQEKALEAARSEGRTAALRENAATTAAFILDSLLQQAVPDEARRSTLVSAVNPAVFVREDGSIDREAVASYSEAIAPTPAAEPPRTPDLSRLGHGATPPVEQRDMAAIAKQFNLI